MINDSGNRSPEGCWHKREIVLNGERIRKMSDEQLACFLRSITDCDICPVEKCLGSSCTKSILHWLEQPIMDAYYYSTQRGQTDD